MIGDGRKQESYQNSPSSSNTMPSFSLSLCFNLFHSDDLHVENRNQVQQVYDLKPFVNRLTSHAG
jgi:hypothetical protein